MDRGGRREGDLLQRARSEHASCRFVLRAGRQQYANASGPLPHGRCLGSVALSTLVDGLGVGGLATARSCSDLTVAALIPARRDSLIVGRLSSPLSFFDFSTFPTSSSTPDVVSVVGRTFCRGGSRCRGCRAQHVRACACGCVRDRRLCRSVVPPPGGRRWPPSVDSRG